MRQGGGMEVLHLPPRAGLKPDHGAVACSSRPAVERPTNPQRKLYSAGLLVSPPARPILPTWLAGNVAARQPERRQHGIIETRRPRKFVGAETNVSKH